MLCRFGVRFHFIEFEPPVPLEEMRFDDNIITFNRLVSTIQTPKPLLTTLVLLNKILQPVHWITLVNVF